MRAVKAEKLGFRDENLSRWHRSLGYDLPATDLDAVWIEYDNRQPSALIEYKHQNWDGKWSASLEALVNLANRAAVPALLVSYAADCSCFYVSPLNDLAEFFIQTPKLFSEAEYVELLHELRGRLGHYDGEDDLEF